MILLNAVEFLQKAVAAMTIRAPRAGMVIVRSRWNDDKFKVGDNVWPGSVIAEIPDPIVRSAWMARRRRAERRACSARATRFDRSGGAAASS